MTDTKAEPKAGPPDLVSGEGESFLDDLAKDIAKESAEHEAADVPLAKPAEETQLPVEPKPVVEARPVRKATPPPPPPPEDVDLSDTPYFDQAVLGSGMPMYSRREPGNRFECRIVARAGHRYDPFHQPGLVRTMTHCMRNGNQELDFKDEKRLQEYLDANFFELKPPDVRTYETVWSGACRKRDAEKLVRFMHALVTKPTFDNIELGRQRTEEECRETPRDVHARTINKLVTQALYGNHQLASAWGIPDHDELMSITEDDIRTCHKKLYGQRNMAIMMAGDVVFADFLADIFDEFNVRGEPYGTPERFIAIEPGHSIHSRIDFKTERGKPSSGFAQLTHTWVTRRGMRYEAFLMKVILEKLLKDQFRDTLKIQPKSMSVRSFISPECETFTIEVTVEHRHLLAVEPVMIGVLQNPTPILKELETVKRKLGAHLDMQAHSITTRLDEAVRDWSERGVITPPEEHAKRYEAMPPERMKEFLMTDLNMHECLIVTADLAA